MFCQMHACKSHFSILVKCIKHIFKFQIVGKTVLLLHKYQVWCSYGQPPQKVSKLPIDFQLLTQVIALEKP